MSTGRGDPLAPFLQAGEQMVRVLSAPVWTPDTFLGPFVIAVTNQRILLARRGWRGRVRRIAREWPRGTPIRASKRMHGVAVRIGEDRRLLYVTAAVAAELEELTGQPDASVVAAPASDIAASASAAPAAEQRGLRERDLRRHSHRARVLRFGFVVVIIAVNLARILIHNSPSSPVVVFTTTTPTQTTPASTGPQQGDSSIAITPTAVWSANSNRDVLDRLDPATGKLVGHPIALSFAPEDLAVAGGDIWVVHAGSAAITRIDPRSGRTVGRPIHTGSAGGGIAVGAHAVWVGNSEGATVSRFDPRSGAAIGEPIRVPRYTNTPLIAAGSVWLFSESAGTITRIDARSGAVLIRAAKVGLTASAIAAGAGSIWVLDPTGLNTARVDERTGRVTPVQLDPATTGDGLIAYGDGALWIAQVGGGALLRVDPLTGTASPRTVQLTNTSQLIAYGDGAVWVTDAFGALPTRVDLRRFAG